MSISNSSPFFLPNNKKLCTHGASALSAPTIPFPKRRRRQPWRRPSFAQAASRAAQALHGAGFQYCRRCNPHPHPVHDPIHGDVSSPLEPHPGSLYRIIVISSSWGHLLVRVPAQLLLYVHPPFQHIVGG